MIGLGRGRITRIAAGDHRQQRGSIGHVARHRAGGVLAVADRHDPAAADQSQRGLDADDAVHGGGADDRAVGLAADRHRDQSGRHRGRGAGAGAAGIAIEHIRIAGLPAAPAPAAAGVVRAEVGPFAEVGLAQDQRASLAQPLDQAGIARRRRIGQRQRAGGGEHTVAGVDVVLEQDRNTVQRAACLRAAARIIERSGELQRIGIRLDHRTQDRAGSVDLLDAVEQLPGQLPAVECAGIHALLQLRGRRVGGGRWRDIGGDGRNRKQCVDECGETDGWTAHGNSPGSTNAAWSRDAPA